MPGKPPAPPPTPPPAPPADPPAPPGDLSGRVDGLEAEQKRQGGMLEQILGRLPGKTPAADPAPGADPAPPGGKSIAELVREGITALETERATAAEADANKQAREDYAARIKALEERQPAENVATPVGVFRAKAQRAVFGITEHSK